jgi:3-oxoadipate enol-lactonase
MLQEGTSLPFLDTASVRLHYLFEQNIDRPILVLSNSLGTDLAMWDAQRPRFRQHFSLLRYDMRGHGRSSTSSRDFSLADLAQDVLALLDHLSLPRVTFCGLSMGGVIGQWLGVNAPARLNALVLCNTAAKIGTAEIWNSRIRLAQTEGMQPIADAVIERWYTPSFRQAQSLAVKSTVDMLRRCDAGSYAQCCAAIRDADLRNEIASIQVPVLVVYGTEDLVTTPADARYLSRRIAKPTILPLHAAHLSNIEAAENFTSGVLDFLLPSPGGLFHG